MVRCPGQDGRNLTVSYHQCPSCHRLVEFFSDELRVRCTGCKTWVYEDQAPNCIQWCKAARQCIGAERYDEIMGLMKSGEDPEENGIKGV